MNDLAGSILRKIVATDGYLSLSAPDPDGSRLLMVDLSGTPAAITAEEAAYIENLMGTA